MADTDGPPPLEPNCCFLDYEFWDLQETNDIEPNLFELCLLNSLPF